MSSLNLNNVVLGGHISSDLELKQTTSGTPVITFRLAVNRTTAKRGEEQEADFFEVTAWQKTAEFIGKYFRKGSSICVIGELRSDVWTDQQGQKRFKTFVNVTKAMFVDSKTEGQDDNRTAYASAPAVSAPKFEEVNNDDDLPF